MSTRSFSAGTRAKPPRPALATRKGRKNVNRHREFIETTIEVDSPGGLKKIEQYKVWFLSDKHLEAKIISEKIYEQSTLD